MLELDLWLGNKNNDKPRGAKSRGESVFASCDSSLSDHEGRKERNTAQLNYRHLCRPRSSISLERRGCYARNNTMKCIYWMIEPLHFTMSIAAFKRRVVIAFIIKGLREMYILYQCNKYSKNFLKREIYIYFNIYMIYIFYLYIFTYILIHICFIL